MTRGKLPNTYFMSAMDQDESSEGRKIGPDIWRAQIFIEDIKQWTENYHAVDVPGGKECWQPPAARGSTGLLTPWSGPSDTDFRLLASRSVRDTSLLFEAAKCVVIYCSLSYSVLLSFGECCCSKSLSLYSPRLEFPKTKLCDIGRQKPGSSCYTVKVIIG